MTQGPQLPFKRPQVPSYRDHVARNRGTLWGLVYQRTRFHESAGSFEATVQIWGSGQFRVDFPVCGCVDCYIKPMLLALEHMSYIASKNSPHKVC